MVIAYVRDPILILKDARTAIIQTHLFCQMYANSSGVEFLIYIITRVCFFHMHVPWRGRPVKILLGTNFSFVCRVQSENVLSVKDDIQDRAYCCNN